MSDCAQSSPLPLRYISQAELASVSSYMRGRLTIETVNSAIDDAASHAEANAKLMAATKANSVKPADRKRATTLLHCVAVCAVCHPPIRCLQQEHKIVCGRGTHFVAFVTVLHKRCRMACLLLQMLTLHTWHTTTEIVALLPDQILSCGLLLI